MDPNATLEEIRRLLAVDQDVGLGQHGVDRLCVLVKALDGWLSKGGFLPEAWAKGRR